MEGKTYTLILDEQQMYLLEHLIRKEIFSDSIREFMDENDEYWMDITDATNVVNTAKSIEEKMKECLKI